jgi:hypothetical protein
MTKKERIKLKKQSLPKWRRIVNCIILGGDKKQFKHHMGHEDCGYCQIYYPTNPLCHNCPLNKKSLCQRGTGKSYDVICDWINYNVLRIFSMSNVVSQTPREVLQNAQRMVRAIEQDILKEGEYPSTPNKEFIEYF